MIVLGSFVKKAEFLRSVLCHTGYGICTQVFVPLLGDAFELFVADSRTFKLPVYSDVMNRNEPVSFEQVEEFISEIIGVLPDKAKQVLKVINIKEVGAPMEGWFGVDHIPRLVPKS
jgi:hypothetical protein